MTVCNNSSQLKSYSSSPPIEGEEVNRLQEETAKALKDWLKRGGVEVNAEEAVRAQLANRSRRD